MSSLNHMNWFFTDKNLEKNELGSLNWKFKKLMYSRLLTVIGYKYFELWTRPRFISFNYAVIENYLRNIIYFSGTTANRNEITTGLRAKPNINWWEFSNIVCILLEHYEFMVFRSSSFLNSLMKQSGCLIKFKKNVSYISKYIHQ